jgi:hypothetical protein
MDASGMIPNNSNNPGGYSAEYVRELREEAASWRTKFRETEARVKTLEESIAGNERTSSIKAELIKRNLEIDVDLIKLEQGEKADQAVDRFLKKYPQFGKPAGKEPTRRPMTPEKQNTNTPHVFDEDYEAVKKDPVARTKLRELYRGMLTNGSNLTIG